MTLNVTHICGKWGLGGTEKAATLLCANFSEDVSVSAVALEPGGERAEMLAENGVEFVVADTPDEIVTHLRDRNVHIVHFHNIGANRISQAIRRANIPVVVKSEHFGWPTSRDSRLEVDYYCFVSQMILLRYLLVERGGLGGDWPKNFDILYNPIEVDNHGKRNGSLREEYGVPLDAPVVGKIGRNAPEKWGRMTIDSFYKLLEKLPEAHLLLLGTPERIRETIRQRGIADKVTYVDPLDIGKVDRFYDAVDVLAHSSAIGESFGYVIAEAMANGIPPVVESTPLRDNAQIELVEDGETGYVANSTEAYTNALSTLLQNRRLREELGDTAAERVREFDVTNVVPRLERIYRRLAAEKGVIDEPIRFEVSDRREEMQEFAVEYDRRLQDVHGTEDYTHRAERATWRAITSSPIGRRRLYEAGRKAFIGGSEYLYYWLSG